MNERCRWMLGGFVVAAFFLLVSGCTGGNVESPITAKAGEVRDGGATAIVEGSKSQVADEPKFVEGSGSKNSVSHPELVEEKKVNRLVLVPKVVQGKWEAVKILIKDKTDEESTTLKTIALGASFPLGDQGLTVTVGPFFPNFVMGRDTYTSMNNELINPAVQLIVEENGKILYKGWAFSKYPTLYAFEHEVYALELKDFIASEVS